MTVAALLAYAIVVTVVAVAFWDVGRRSRKDAQMYRELWRHRARMMDGR